MNHTSRAAAIQVGIAGLLALIALIVGVVWLKEFRLGQKKTYYSSHFEEVGSLAVGDPVAVRGVKKGAVTKIVLEDQGVRVEFELQKDVILHPDVELRVTNKGFLGEKFLALDPGDTPGVYDHAKPIPGRFQSGVPEVIAGAGELSSRLNVMLDAMDPATIERAAKNVEKASTSLSKTIDDNKADLKAAVTDFRSAAKKLNSIASINEEQVTSSINDFGSASRKLNALSDQLSTTATSLDRVIKRMDNGEGSLGKAMQDSTLYLQMLETMRNTNDLVKDIKKNPGRYVKIGLF
jgi:phospholipid/cholesterol/gamma-HCH transport system substrate-binding protein